MYSTCSGDGNSKSDSIVIIGWAGVPTVLYSANSPSICYTRLLKHPRLNILYTIQRYCSDRIDPTLLLLDMRVTPAVSFGYDFELCFDMDMQCGATSCTFYFVCPYGAIESFQLDDSNPIWPPINRKTVYLGSNFFPYMQSHVSKHVGGFVYFNGNNTPNVWDK